MSDYFFNGSSFHVKNYLEKATFANFLPGVAGKKGIPLWAFYVNRGQGISGFGIQDKNGPIMEFTPANKAYETVGQIGFRTFLKVNQSYYEPFVVENKNPHLLIVDREGFTIEETSTEHNLTTNVSYFGLPNENLGGLVRRVAITNNGDQPIDVEILDGLAEIIPAGIRNAEFKEISNLLMSWMDVDDLEHNFAFYKLRSSTSDTSEVVEKTHGNFLFSIFNNQLIKPIVDQEIVFGYDSSKRTAIPFIHNNIETLQQELQVTVNKVPCGFTPVHTQVEPQQTIHIDTVIGYTHNKDHLLQFMNRALEPEYLNQKQQDAKAIIDELIQDVDTKTAQPLFNEYIKQNYLDNLLRGGYPHKIGNTIYHLFSRRHGDLERDYNFFSLAPEYYSQGGGNFRDVCQNRRMDSAINRDVEAFNVKHFASLIQLDGFNPLTVNGMTYQITDKTLATHLVNRHFITGQDDIIAFISNKFTPGGLVNFIENNQFDYVDGEEDYLNDIVSHAKEEIESAFGEGYWADHFTYILDLIEEYEAVYPDKLDHLLFHENDIKTFDSPVYVLPKNEKAVINRDGNIRQYGSLLHWDQAKITKYKMNPHASNWARIGNDTYQTNLFTKLFILAMNKHSNLDPDLIGVEMEANKPGWNDAMNGVPGLFGSGVSETIELLRIVQFIKQHLPEEHLQLPKELYDLFQNLNKAMSYTDILYARHQYREESRFGLSNEFHNVSHRKLALYFDKLEAHIHEKLDLLYREYDGIIPTFLVYDVTDYQPLVDKNNEPIIGNYKMPTVHPKAFERRALPRFLEAPARLLKTDYDKDKLVEMYHKIKQSGIYDAPLKMYKTSEPLDVETNEIGRVRAFTKGWLERESNFLHMTYKYLVGLLRAELYDEFFEELQDNFVCFMDPARYKRSTLENSSFLAPSNNPNPHIHGQGFFARLSGSTVEAVNIWYILLTGGRPFQLKEGSLILKMEPKLPQSYFLEDKTVTFTFMKDIEVTYVNEDMVDTYKEGRVVKYELSNHEETVLIDGAYINGKYASLIREGLYKKIKIYIKF